MRFFPIPLLVALAFIAGSNVSFAANECGPAVRLDSPGGTMEHVPVVDQGDFGICYAAVAAEKDDAYRISHGGNPAVHASMVEGAIGSGQVDKESVRAVLDTVGGDECDVASYYKAKGSCSESALDGKGNPLPSELSFLAKSYDIQDETQPSSGGSCGGTPKKHDPVAEAKVLLKDQSCTEDEATKENLATTQKAMMDVLGSITQRVEGETQTQLAQDCEAAGRQHSGFSSCKSSSGLFIHPRDQAKTEKFVLKYLTSKKAQPLAIGYCSKMLTAGDKYVGINPTPKNFDDRERCDCNSHESIIIGKRSDPKTGKCEVLIQNSWGTDCDGYSKDWTCEKGKIWVDADVLIKNIEDYSYLQ